MYVHYCRETAQDMAFDPEATSLQGGHATMDRLKMPADFGAPMPPPHTLARKMFLVLDLFRDLDPNLAPTFMQVFFAVAEAPLEKGLETRALPQRLELSHSAINRAVTYMGERHWKSPDRPGLNLFRVEMDPYDRRQRIAKLTAKGRKLLERINELLYG